MLDVPTLTSTLDPFVAEGWITGEALLLKSGKEATAYRCRATPESGREFFVAKVYREQESRSFKNDAIYREGRYIGESRLRRALANKSRKGREVQFATWGGDEYATLRLLHAAGAGVPEPVARAGSSTLMGYIGDEEGAAPQLQKVEPAPGEARRLFATLVREVELWLGCNRVHGDLSPYNILYWDGALTVIDFPQAVDPRSNPNAYELLARDLANVGRYFARYGVEVDTGVLAHSLWSHFLRAEL